MDSPFARALKARRDKLGLKQHEVAASLDVDVSTISFWEKGRFEPSFDKFDKIAAFLDVSLSKLLKLLHESKKSRTRKSAA